MRKENILIWLPSPLGDAVLCTPALRAIRNYFSDCRITFFANKTVREVLSPTNFCDNWLEQREKNPFATASQLKEYKFGQAILFKNSFASGLAVFLAKIPVRIGYARQARGLFLTDKLYAPKRTFYKFKPCSVIDYYLAIAYWLGADTEDRTPELLVGPEQIERLRLKFPEIRESKGPVAVLVPGGAFGPSKCWPAERFAKTADRLIENYKATVFVSVSPDPFEKNIAEKICSNSKFKLITLGQRPVNLTELKSLISIADIVICNDTGPRHIAIALKRKVVTIFGPNNPQWTDTSYDDEIKIIAKVPCAPCDRPKCSKSEHLCMESISVESVCEAVKKLLK